LARLTISKNKRDMLFLWLLSIYFHVLIKCLTNNCFWCKCLINNLRLIHNCIFRSRGTVVFSQNLPFSNVMSIFKVNCNALKMQNLNFCRSNCAYLSYLLWFVSCNRKETRHRRPWTIDLNFEKIVSGWKPLDPIFVTQ